jgi:hypothetical protein
MNLSMDDLPEQFKLFDEITYPDPNPYHAGDVVVYKDCSGVSSVKSVNTVLTEDYAHGRIFLMGDIEIGRNNFEDLILVRKHKPELFKYENSQEVWWDGIDPLEYDELNSYNLKESYTEAQFVTIVGKELFAYLGYCYEIHAGDSGNWFVYPEHLFENKPI